MSKKLIYLTSFVLVLALAGTNVVFAGLVVESRVRNSTDDREQNVGGGLVSATSSDLEIPYEDTGKSGPQIIGLRFLNIGVPPGAGITNAYVEFTCDETKDGSLPVSLLIEGELSPDTVTFSSSADVAGRPRTTAKAVWAPANWTGAGQVDQTSNIASIIQEIVNQPGWASGNSLVLIISDDPANPSTGLRCAEAFDGAATQAPLLHIEFTSKRATQPSPADGVIIEDTWATLGWTPGDTAASHDVYFGENSVDVDAGTGGTFMGNQADAYLLVGFPGFAYPEGLAPGATYYWRIDAVEADGTTIHKGHLWSFAVQSRTASNPDPADRAKSVDPDAVLSWTPGFGAKLHTVYFGESFDDVNTATGSIPQAAATYTPTPSPLAEKTVYYWRVDEFDGVDTHKGDVWSFKTSFIADPNLIGWWTFDEGQGTGALDSSGYNNHGTIVGNPQWVEGIIGGALYLDGGTYVVIDGVADDITDNDITLSVWVNTTDDDCEVIACNTSGYGNVVRWAIDGGKAAIDDDAPEAHSQTMVSDGKWHMLTYTRKGDKGYIYVDGIQQNTNLAVYGFGASNRWSIGQEWDSGGPSGFWPGTVDDVRIYNTALTADEIKQIMRGDAQLAWNPSPRNNATVDVDKAKQPLTWSPGEDAAEHDVYFGTDEMAVDAADASDTTGVYRGRQTAASYTVSEALAWGTGPYYWRIDEYNKDATVSTGRLWNFTVADYLIVDDIESYNDLDPGDPASNRIFNVWIDGYGVATNGSLVGYENSPFCEQSIVHGGRQSMPFAYDNSGTARYSEATLTLTQRDWTKEGVGALTVWFRGDSANTAAPMSITINGTATVTHGDPDAALIGAWTQWNIPLTDFSNQGVVLTNVNSIAIGLGDKTSPQPSGSGMMFFDDIRLYR